MDKSKNKRTLEKPSYMQELAEDLIAIVTSFATKIYGQRGFKKK